MCALGGNQTVVGKSEKNWDLTRLSLKGELSANFVPAKGLISVVV